MTDLYKGFLEYESEYIDKFLYFKSEIYKFNRKFDNCIMVQGYDVENNIFYIYINKSIDKDLFERISSKYEFEDDFYLKLDDTNSFYDDYYRLNFEPDWIEYLYEFIDTFTNILTEYAKLKR